MLDLTNRTRNSLIQEPSNVRNFIKDSDFIEWLNLGSIADLNAALDAFQDAQMFEDCLSSKSIKPKKNQIVTRID
jgi:hypothetical protein